MINYIKGDLFTTKDRLIAHGCNSHGVMGSGVAAAIKKMYPGAFEAYKEGPHEILGNIIYYKDFSYDKNGTIIANCITQKEYGRNNTKYVSYDAVDTCMENLVKYCVHNDIGSISMPKIGAGLGGGKWAIIEEIIKAHFERSGVLVNIYYLD